ncbi:Tll0287-like domain-containing protein [Yunchengibacter salinarum]|uniref:Tll0287-like domain-containing protein n=1 Tax=Yunchengibacter salinarum TaxID=3133399 RepID=UPI0035B5F1F9
MRLLGLLGFLVLAGGAVAAMALQQGRVPGALTVEARTVTRAFATALKAELKAAISKGGPVAGIRVCHERAPAIAERVGDTHGWTVGRTSHRLRNPANAPDAWEREGLRAFMLQIARGRDAATLERTLARERDGSRTFRYMKPIIMGDVCTLCHGTSLSPDIQAALDRLYPADEATGFEPGDLRGAFTLTRTMPVP